MKLDAKTRVRHVQEIPTPADMNAPIHAAFAGRHEEIVHRSQLKNAPYNPRVLNEKERAALKRGIKKLGMLGTPTWNRRTSNMVGGHQRVEILDALHGSEDYRLPVFVVDLSDVEEREGNILLNNQQAAGDWDLEKLAAIFGDKRDKVSLEGTGFETGDVYRLFGDSPFEDRSEELTDLATRVREFGEELKAKKKSAAHVDKYSQNFYLCVVFESETKRDEFVAEFGLDDNVYQDARTFRRILGKNDD